MAERKPEKTKLKNLEASIPELIAELHALLKQVLLGGGHVNLRLGGADLSVAMATLEDAQQPLDANRHAHARNLLGLGVRVEHGHQVVVAAAASDRANLRAGSLT